jgi:predicted aminopeptidase
MRAWIVAAAGSFVTLGLLVAAACLGSGCSSLGYYAQAVGGHVDMLQRARPVSDWLADDATPAALRERLALAARLRSFAVRDLQLPDGASYRRYADLGRPAAVFNVVAAPELSLELKTWCFPVAGCVGYRGYFDRAAAEATATGLRAQGWEAHVYGVPAYSTLGRTDWLGGDPLLNTFVGWPEGELARLLFHEMAHQVVYAPDDTAFNESFATAVERIGLRRWLAAHAGEDARREQRAFEARREDFRELTSRTRARLDALYGSAQDAATKRAGKAALMAEMRAEHQRLKAGRWQGFAGYDRWFDRADNAALGVLGAYDDFVPAFEHLFLRLGGDFSGFYAEVRRLAALPKAERHATLRALTKGN